MSHLSKIKNPDLPMSVRSSGPAGLRTTSCLLGCFSHLGNHCFLLWLIKAGVHYIPAMPCQLLAVSYCRFPYLDHPLCAISCIDHCHIRHASSPPKAYRRCKGDSSINHRNTKASGIYCCVLWVSFVPRPQLGPF